MYNFPKDKRKLKQRITQYERSLRDRHIEIYRALQSEGSRDKRSALLDEERTLSQKLG